MGMSGVLAYQRAFVLLAGLLFCAQVLAGVQELARKAIPDQVISELAVSQGTPTHEVLRKVNAYFNALRYTTDLHQWHTSDYWSTPAEFLRAGRGDCEDYVIAKYFSLLRLGIPDQQLRFLMVRRVEPGGRFVNHMVLLYKGDDGEELVLDNLTPGIRPLRERKDLNPVYVFDIDNMWLWSTNQKPAYYGNTAMLVPLQKMLSRI